MKFRHLLFALLAMLAISLDNSAQACPMCRLANESKKDNALPRAYMYSILFMLGVPTSVATGFGIGFYRLSKKRDELLSADESQEDHHLEPQ